MPIAYPYTINHHYRTASVEGAEYFEELIAQVLFTMPGERVNRPDFGSNLMQLVFSPENNELIAAHQFMLQGELQRWLGDIIHVETVNIKAHEGILNIKVQYLIQSSQERQIKEFNYAF